MVRSAVVERKTKETEIALDLCLDGGLIEVSTGIGFFDHMLTALAFYAGFGMKLSVKGDLHVDGHHTVEDTGIVLGQAIKEALGDKHGIKRFASSFIPMDEALSFCVIDVSGRAFLNYDAVMPQEKMGDYESCLTWEFMRALTSNAALTLHIKAMYGNNTHHITESIYKAVGSAMKEAFKIEGGAVKSTKGKL